MENRFIDYFTEQDLIDRYLMRRKTMKREEVEDLYKAFIQYILFRMENKKENKMGFHVKCFFSFMHKRLKIDNLKLPEHTPKYKRAFEQLHHWLSGHQRLKIEN